MGIIRTEFQFFNPANRALSPVSATALVDTGARRPQNDAYSSGLFNLKPRYMQFAYPICATKPLRSMFSTAFLRSLLPDWVVLNEH